MLTDEPMTPTQQPFLDTKALSSQYLDELLALADDPELFPRLLASFQQWQERRPKTRRLGLSRLEAKAVEEAHLSTLPFLRKLWRRDQLQPYLEKSIAYVFLRDLGQSLTDAQTQRDITAVVNKIIRWVRNSAEESGAPWTSRKAIFAKAEALHIETTLFWLLERLHLVHRHLPAFIDPVHGMRKLVKIIAGVFMHQLMRLPEDATPRERGYMLEAALRLGYAYGLTYPLIDDVLDAEPGLTPEDKEAFNTTIRQSLILGEVQSCPEFTGPYRDAMWFIYEEMKGAFNAIRSLKTQKEARMFFDRALIFFDAQDEDRRRRLDQGPVPLKTLCLTMILKSAHSRLVARELLSQEPLDDFHYRTFCFGIYNQFNDDIKDIEEDLANQRVTPYTDWLSRTESQRRGALHPYRLYWAVVSFLIHRVYGNETQTRNLLLERCLNAHQSVYRQRGPVAYQTLCQQLLQTPHQEFNDLFHHLVTTPNDVAWFDKLISREVAHYFQTQDERNRALKKSMDAEIRWINDQLPLTPAPHRNPSPVIDAANYSLICGGKRLRGLLALQLAKGRYHLSDNTCGAIIRLLEYMHTASLIFDDKPSQDNADRRRGHPTLHRYTGSEATAELAGITLMMKAVEVLATLQEVPGKRVQRAIAYAAQTTQAIAEGQHMDLNATPEHTTAIQLETISFLKTGLALEAALIIPAILANEKEGQMAALRAFAKPMGIAFQIRDDLLDVQPSNVQPQAVQPPTGQASDTGKPANLDQRNHRASFVTVLGNDEAYRQLAKHYQAALGSLEALSPPLPWLGHLLDLVVFRTH
jgi:geranylgeranyl pyrophosphate synthase